MNPRLSMESDIALLSLTADKTLSDQLVIELELLGADVIANAVGPFATLDAQVEQSEQRHTMPVLLVTESLVEAIEAADVKLRKVGKAVAMISFGLKKEMQEIAERRLEGMIVSKAQNAETFALDVIAQLAKPHRAKRLTPRGDTRTIWKSPLYMFKARTGLSAEEDEEILIDVTWSAKPTRRQMAPALKKALRATFDHLNRPKLKILDFGAGKLRHTLPLLEKGHCVDAVDYRSLYQKPSPEVKRNLQKTQKFGARFSAVIYPQEFTKLTRSYDLIIAVNVLNIMPEPLERYFVLDRCNHNLSSGGHFLLFCQHGDAAQLKAVKNLRITDGGCTSKKGRKTFYTDFNNQELIIRMMDVMGFEHVRLKIDSGNNHALLFRRAKKPAMDVDLVIRTSRQPNARRVHTGQIASEIAVADVFDGGDYVGYGSALATALKNITSGKKTAYKYEDLVAPVIEYIFQKEFVRAMIEKQYEILNGKQRIDIKAVYRESAPLRSALLDAQLQSSWIPIECKNYSGPLSNPEYGQMVMRCDRRHRQFGMIFCRHVDDRRAVTQICHDIYNQHGYLIVVSDDTDLTELLRLADDERFEDTKNRIVARVHQVLDLAK